MSDATFDFNSLAARLAKHIPSDLNVRVEALTIVGSCCELATCEDLQSNLSSLLLDVLSFGGACNLRFFEHTYPILGAVWMAQAEKLELQVYEVVTLAKSLADKFLRDEEHATLRLKLIDQSTSYTGLVKTILLLANLNQIDLVKGMQSELDKRSRAYALELAEEKTCSSCGEAVINGHCSSKYCGDAPDRYRVIN